MSFYANFALKFCQILTKYFHCLNSNNLRKIIYHGKLLREILKENKTAEGVTQLWTSHNCRQILKKLAFLNMQNKIKPALLPPSTI